MNLGDPADGIDVVAVGRAVPPVRREDLAAADTRVGDAVEDGRAGATLDADPDRAADGAWTRSSPAPPVSRTEPVP